MFIKFYKHLYDPPCMNMYVKCVCVFVFVCLQIVVSLQLSLVVSTGCPSGNSQNTGKNMWIIETTSSSTIQHVYLQKLCHIILCMYIYICIFTNTHPQVSWHVKHNIYIYNYIIIYIYIYPYPPIRGLTGSPIPHLAPAAAPCVLATCWASAGRGEVERRPPAASTQRPRPGHGNSTRAALPGNCWF